MVTATMLGLISDTHGLMRERALTALKGCDLIIHAGDVGKPTIIERLRAIAPVVAVRGTLTTALASQLPVTARTAASARIRTGTCDRKGSRNEIANCSRGGRWLRSSCYVRAESSSSFPRGSSMQSWQNPGIKNVLAKCKNPPKPFSIPFS